jgi:hypothetical protein
MRNTTYFAVWCLLAFLAIRELPDAIAFRTKGMHTRCQNNSASLLIDKLQITSDLARLDIGSVPVGCRYVVSQRYGDLLRLRHIVLHVTNNSAKLS